MTHRHGSHGPPNHSARAIHAEAGHFSESQFVGKQITSAPARQRACSTVHFPAPPAFVVGSETVVALEPSGPLVGLLTPGWDTAEAVVGPGDNLCAYTDGLIETRNPDHEFFGPERLIELLQGSRCDEAPAVVKRTIDEVELFSPGGLRDDATIVVLCRAE